MTKINTSEWAHVYGNPSRASAQGIAYVDDGTHTFWHRSEGFRAAGDLMVAASEVGEATERDLLAFPTLYVYRHAVELRLKELLILSHSYLGDTSNIPKTHDLVELWTLVETDLRQCNVGAIEPYRSQVSRTLRILQASDTTTATEFRYPMSKAEERRFPASVKRLDVTVIAARIGYVLDALEGWMDGLWWSIENQREASEMLADLETESAVDWFQAPN